jgi:hypothetical protein
MLISELNYLQKHVCNVAKQSWVDELYNHYVVCIWKFSFLLITMFMPCSMYELSE